LKAPEAPGWYPDPADNGRMRRWDGSRWTGESRSMPPWAGPKPGGRKRIATHWLVFGGVALLLFLLTTFKAFTAKPDLPKRTLFDTAFIAQANAACKAQLTPMKAQRPKPGSKQSKDPGTEEQVAAQVEDVANRLHALAQDLRAIPVASAGQAAVQGWLADWDAYTDLGHQYADAVRKKESIQTKLVDDAAKRGQRADLFAQANKLDACTFS
jgi:Protein of unknown function (DUF2510)